MPRGIEDQVVHANTFTVLPSEIKESAFDVSGTALHDWSFCRRAGSGAVCDPPEESIKGKWGAFAKMLAACIFSSDRCGDAEHNGSALNSTLGLPKERVDHFAKPAIEREK